MRKTRTSHRASDGHLLSSYYEWLFDEYLYLNNIPHEIEGFIAPPSRCRYDFKIRDVYVEIWGITAAGSECYNNYCLRRSRKESIYKDKSLKLISIEGTDFQKSSLELQTLFKSKLAEFGIESSDEQVSYPIFSYRKIGYWNDETIRVKLKEIIEETGQFPTSRVLFSSKRYDLAAAIVKHGGYRKFAKLLGYEPQTKEYSSPYVVDELNKLKKILGHFPCDRELQELHRSDLAGMIKMHGGYGYFKELVDGGRDKRPFGYWNDENNILLELKALIAKLGHFPAYNELGQVAKGIDKSKKGMRYFQNLVEGGNEIHGRK